MKDIIGHQKVLDFFAKVNSGGNLSHAYCFVGPEQVGKKAVAKALAVQLLEVEQERLVSNPDFFSIKRGINEKTGKTSTGKELWVMNDKKPFFQQALT